MTLGCFAGLQGWECSMAWIVMVFIFFIGAIIKRQIADNLLNMSYSVIGATILSEIGFIISMYISHSFRWSFVIAIILNIVGGFVGASFLPDGEAE